jgi:hypothetical protein
MAGVRSNEARPTQQERSSHNQRKQLGRGGSTRWGETNPKYMDPVDRRLRGCLRQRTSSQAHERVSGTHTA